MAKIINFLDAKKKCPTSFTLAKKFEFETYNSTLNSIFEVDEYLLELIYQWPCFSKGNSNQGLRELLDKYCKHTLPADQECVLDFVLHIHDPKFIFDISFALNTWNDRDRFFFKFFIDEFAQVLSHNKKK